MITFLANFHTGLRVACMSLLFISAAHANDAALYAPEPPENAAFVRIINATSQNLEDIALGGITFGTLEALSISPYHIVPEGNYTSPADEAVSWDVAPKKYYALTMNGSHSALIEEEGIEDPAKSKIYFYNLTNKNDATLHAPKHGVDIVESVAAHNTATKAINALTLAIDARVAGEEIASFPSVELQRRIGTTFVITQDESGKISAFYSDNQQAQ